METEGIKFLSSDPNRSELSFSKTPSLRIAPNGETMVEVWPDGRVDYGPNYTPDAAARTFWEAVASWLPKHRFDLDLDALDLTNCAVLVARIPLFDDSEEADSFRHDLLDALHHRLGPAAPLVVFLANPEDSLEVLDEAGMRAVGWVRA